MVLPFWPLGLFLLTLLLLALKASAKAHDPETTTESLFWAVVFAILGA